MRTIQGDMIGSGLRFAIIGSRFNELITSKLIEGAKDALSRHGVSFSDIDLYWTPGAWEQPVVAKEIALLGKYDAIISLGNLEQALMRAGSKAGNKGAEAALAALETAKLMKEIRNMRGAEE